LLKKGGKLNVMNWLKLPVVRLRMKEVQPHDQEGQPPLRWLDCMGDNTNQAALKSNP